MPTIYPLLKPHDWPHQHLVVHRKLSETVAEAPIITFGFDAGENYRFTTSEECQDQEALYREALENLSALDYSWEFGESKGLPHATSSGKEFSAERILSPKAMLEAHEILKSDRIIAAAPRRTCIIATRDGLPADVMNLFIRLVMFTYGDDSYGHAPISSVLYVLEKGVIKDVKVVAEPPANSASKPWWKFWN